MRIVSAELRTFRTTVRRSLLVRVTGSLGEEGWGECVADDEPTHSAEYLEGAADVIRRFLLPALLAVPDLDPAGVAPALAHLRGQPMAKSAMEMAVLDAVLRARGLSLASYLGAVRRSVQVGASVGIADSLDSLLDTVDRHVSAGYARIKLKIQPGWDLEPVRVVRETFGGGLMLTADASMAYTPASARHLARLDAYGLALLEQPYDADDLHGHAMLAARMETPICLDESITSARAAIAALRAGACSIINIKPGRVGGYLEARRIHDLCLAADVPVWCGGTLETGLGRAANLALAALPGFTLPGDISATDPVVLDGDSIAVPDGPGIGVTPSEDALEAFTQKG
ncbi:o-succinylbenzoate synthase [Nonomuraea sp. NPDC050556]|uniref:o-succinylbenzoate synthase n=1 Tax=Nonomuraea sp. NPDC050556 TaxID=3364369 RepID=UPI003792E0E0